MAWWRGKLCLTIREAHRLTGVATADLSQMVQSGELSGPAPVGKTLLIWPESLEGRFGPGVGTAATRLNPKVERKLQLLSRKRE